MASTMRIGIATPKRGFAGGLERYSWMVAQGLKERGHHVRHLFSGDEGRDPELFTGAFSEASRRLSPDAVSDLDLVFAQRVDEPSELQNFGDRPLVIASHDHAHTCIRTYRYVPLGAKPCHRKPGLACVANGCSVNRVRRADGSASLELRSPFALRNKLKILAARAPLVACSRYVADNLIAAGVPPERALHVHPIPADESRPLVPRPSEHRLVVVAQLVRGKGIEFAIEALCHLPQSVTLRVVGDGPSMESLKELAERVARGRVEFTGYVAPEEVVRHYDAARVVLVPSRWPEPFGMVGIEAMRRARPVVAARHGGIPEWAPDEAGGRLFEPGSAQDLALGARAMLDSESAGEDALRYTQKHHRHERLLDELEAIFKAQTQS